MQLWTSTDPKRSHSVVSFRPGNLDIPKLAASLYEKDRLAGAPRLGADRGGLRFSPHYYNLHSEVERALAAVKRYMRKGGVAEASRKSKARRRVLKLRL